MWTLAVQQKLDLRFQILRMRIVAATSNAGSATHDQGGYCEQRRKMGKGTGKGTGPLDESFKLMAMGTVQ